MSLFPLLSLTGGRLDSKTTGTENLLSGTTGIENILSGTTGIENILSIAKKHSIVGEIAIFDQDSASENKVLIEQVLHHVEDCRVGGINTAEDALFYINAGATKIFVNPTANFLSSLPKDRLVVSLLPPFNDDIHQTILKLKESVSGFLILSRHGDHDPINYEWLTKLKQAVGDLELTVTGGITTLDEVKLLLKHKINVQIPPGLIDFGVALASTLVSDRSDGLFPTVVVDEQSVALGLVYSSQESIIEAIKLGQGVYQSRSRGLWYKGETSGAKQDLLRVRVDCDNDCLCFVVRQHGVGFCHKNQRTCFGSDPGLGKLMRVLESRKVNPTPGSYTNRLFQDPALLHSKLREEVEELIEAQNKKEVALEAADVIYFTLVTAVKAGVNLDDINKILETRSRTVTRRKGDAKPANIQPKSDIPTALTLAPALTPEVVEPTPSPTPAPVKTPEEPVFTALRRVLPSSILTQEKLDPVDPQALKIATQIVEDVRTRGETALLHYATKFGDIPEGGQLILDRAALKSHFDALPEEQQRLLERSAARVRLFAQAQRDSVQDLSTPIEGGTAGHTIAAVERAGCYAPGGRFPLLSSVLMTAVTAKVAGVKTVWACSPRPLPITAAAAYVAGCDALLQVGGAQAIGALAYGVGDIPAMDAIVGPGNKYVTAAKAVVSGLVRIDLLAGPSEVLVIADSTADPAVIAADLLAQAEHDPDAAAILVTVNAPDLPTRVDVELVKQLALLETKPIANLSLFHNSFVVETESLDAAIEISDKIAPEHLELHVKDAQNLVNKPKHYGGLFLGAGSAEVLGDYCAGPNHVLPTRGTARYAGGLSVFTFLRVRTWLTINPDDSPQQLVVDAAQLAILEGLVGHSAAAKIRIGGKFFSEKWEDREKILTNFIRPDFRKLAPYVPIKPLDVLSEELGIPVEKLVKLDANENAYGPVQEIRDVIQKIDTYHIYPDPGQTYLRRAIASYLGVSPSMIVTGSGADDLLDITIRLVPEHRPLVLSSPTFGMYSFLGHIASRPVLDVPRLDGSFAIDTDRIIQVVNASHASIVFITSPNNPTGNIFPRDDLIRVLMSVRHCLVGLDEAYIEFFPEGSSVDLVSKFPNLVIYRTFSKWAALAGLRVGYCVTHPEIARCMDTIKQPYNVNVVADFAARAALENVDKILKTQIVKIIDERTNLYKLLSQYTWLHPYPSSVSNFILSKVLSRPAWLVAAYLRRNGILIRHYSTPRLIDCIRISVGRPEDTSKLKILLDELTAIDDLDHYANQCDALLWDIDGVLADIRESYIQAIIQTCNKFGVSVSALDVAKIQAKGSTNHYQSTLQLILNKDKSNAATLESVTSHLSLLYNGTSMSTGLWNAEQLIPSTTLLSALSKFKMAIVTTRPEVETRRFLDQFKLNKYFQSVIYHQPTDKHSQSPDPLLKAVRELNANKAIFISSNPNHMAAANYAGIVGIGAVVMPGSDSEANKILGDSGALRIINNLDQLKSLLKVN